jgi:hypothetical protein
MKRILALALGLPAISPFVAAQPAQACSPALSTHSDTEIARLARRAVDEADVIVDAVVAEPMARDQVPGTISAAVLEVSHAWKGKTDPRILLIYVSSCDIALMEKGERVRLLLRDRRDGVLSADQEPNGYFFHIEAESVKYGAALDAVIGKPRPSGTTLIAGRL